MPAGRPSKYKEEFCETVVECGRAGMGKLETCAELDICYETFENWQKQHEQFSEAVKRAQQLSQAWWERKGREGAIGEISNFNATTYIFNMKNRFAADWRDKQVSEHVGKDDGELVFKWQK